MDISGPSISQLRRRIEDLDKKHGERLIKDQAKEQPAGIREGYPRAPEPPGFASSDFSWGAAAEDSDVQGRIRALSADCNKLRRYLAIIAEQERGAPKARVPLEVSIEDRVLREQRKLLRGELGKLEETLKEHLSEGHQWADKAELAQSVSAHMPPSSGEFLSLLGMSSKTILDDGERPCQGTLRWSRNDDQIYEGVDLVIGRDGFAVREIAVDGDSPIEIERSLRSYVSTKQLGTHLLNCPYVQLTIHKYLMETQKVIDLLAYHSECEPGEIGYAGRKDKHGDTTQRITMPQEAFLRFFRKHRHLKLPFRIGDPVGVDRQLKLGDLSGNYFRLVLCGDPRTIDSTDHDFALQKIADDGFLNYFGSQRFGSPRYMTPVVGWHLNRGVVEEAVMSLLCGTDDVSRLYVGERIKKKDFNSLQKLVPRDVSSRDDTDLIEALVKYPRKSWRSKIPSSLWTTYNNSFESLLWNYAASNRIVSHGTNTAVGDLWLDEGRVLLADGHNLPDLTRVVLPTPIRFGVQPNNSTANFISSLASGLGVKEDVLKNHGRFRPLIVKPTNLKWERLPGKLAVSFILPTGSFATSLIREWLGMHFFQPGGGQGSCWLPDACFRRLDEIRNSAKY
ncbi:hypothetical protein FOL47_006376 [Perkinsus chesapeaki]|uniref:TRUD domain-containing protein n=1 Tax=Perkinsus chesapeaki TaxID=330153 RepID=A0A7J6LSA5_PERCH|nr:hypothetical protein FOL47_006376 [Perkinsus chesapeaki]